MARRGRPPLVERLTDTLYAVNVRGRRYVVAISAKVTSTHINAGDALIAERLVLEEVLGGKLD